MPRRSITSTRPGVSSSAARRAIAASPDARSSSIPTAAWAGMAVARSRARIRRRSTARPATWRAISRRTSSLPGLADRVEIQLAYAIGVADPVSVAVDTFGTGKIDEDEDLRTRPRKLPADAARNHRIARTCAARSTGRPPATATLAATNPNSPGKRQIRPLHSSKAPDCRKLATDCTGTRRVPILYVFIRSIIQNPLAPKMMFGNHAATNRLRVDSGSAPQSPYVFTRSIIQNPPAPKIRFGNHAAMNGESRLIPPSFSKSSKVDQ